MDSAISSHIASDQPSAWVARFAPLIPPGEVLDLACGSGRHARLLAALGRSVCAIDRDPAALERTAGPGILTRQIDLESGSAEWPFESERFAGIVVTNYLHRPLFPHIFRSIAPDGVLIYETFAQGNAEFGRPANPLHLLRHGELLAITAGADCSLHIVAYEDGYVETPKRAMVQRICVVKTGPEPAPGHVRLI